MGGCTYLPWNVLTREFTHAHIRLSFLPVHHSVQGQGDYIELQKYIGNNFVPKLTKVKEGGKSSLPTLFAKVKPECHYLITSQMSVQFVKVII